MKNILVTGGLGFIGSHTVVSLVENGYRCVILDNLSNCDEIVLVNIKKILGDKSDAVIFYKGDITIETYIENIMEKHEIHACIHFAGLKAVGESVEYPLRYYHNNISGTVTLLNVLNKYGCNHVIFSSSATVYGANAKNPYKITEEDTLGSTNPYGSTKLFNEYILRDVYNSDPNRWNIDVLRYFNPIGAHLSGLIGENPKGIPNNLLPYIMDVVRGKREELSVFGDSYDTKDGTGVRDYIHVMDLANGHVASLNNLFQQNGCFRTFNLGCGKGYSVMDVIKTVEKESNTNVKYSIKDKRNGDVACCVCDPKKANDVLGWKTELTLDDAVRDCLHFV